jgi:hypothetical protein
LATAAALTARGLQEEVAIAMKDPMENLVAPPKRKKETIAYVR